MQPYQKNTLSALANLSEIVIDSCDYNCAQILQAKDATTNPSLVLKAMQSANIEQILSAQKIKELKADCLSENDLIDNICDILLITLCQKILAKVKGLVSLEVDADLSYDRDKTITKVHHLLDLCDQYQLDKSRILIKIASTWQGICATQFLQNQGINCNLTLIFNPYQAYCCAKAKAYLISPFVGRVLDWYKINHPKQDYSDPNLEPGVLLVRQIYQQFKTLNFKTIVMAASFRNIGEILALAGCDKLTIAPDLLEQLAGMSENVSRNIDQKINLSDSKFSQFNQKEFNKQLNNDQMAQEKLTQGVEIFTQDRQKLKVLIKNQLAI